MFQFRDTDMAILDRLDAAMTELLDEAAKGPCKVSVTYRSSTTPSAMDPGFQSALQEAAQRHAPGLHQTMPSGAGHDAQIIAQMLPSAMLFVPSIGGISHHYAENTRDEDSCWDARYSAMPRRRSWNAVRLVWAVHTHIPLNAIMLSPVRTRVCGGEPCG